MILKAIITAAWSLYAVSLLGSEADAYRQKAEAVSQEAQALLKQGRQEEAEHLQQVAKKLQQAAQEFEQWAKPPIQTVDGSKIEETHRRLGQQLGDLLAQERKLRESKAGEGDLAHVRQQIDQTERELKNLQSMREPGKHDKPQPFANKELAGIKQRIHHLRTAAENLEKAEMPELAKQIYDRADQFEREAIQIRERLTAETQVSFTKPQKHDKKQDVLRDLQEQIEQLRAEVRSLREAIGKQ